jgi:predicted metal-dependent enzyme (double-stranded beta helix superfamily)
MSGIGQLRGRIAGLAKLDAFVTAIDALLDRTADEQELLDEAGGHLARLVATDDWLPDVYAQPDPVRYRQYLLYRDPDARFSVVSFVWGPGQATPIHNHTVWGLVGMLRGAEVAERYEPDGGSLRLVGSERLEPGDVDAVSPRIGDVHRVSNAVVDGTSVSIHLYGADIGAVERAVFDSAGVPRPFVSGYADAALPALNIGIA